MEELDLLKKAWQKDSHSYEQISESEIYNMLHKKSSSIVKWIFYISLFELGFGFILSLVMSFTKYDTRNVELLKKWNIYEVYVAFSVIIYLVVFYFIYKFYLMYKNISVVDNTKQLLSSILKTRKVVKNYVIFNLSTFAFLFITIFSLGLYHGYVDAMFKNGIEHPVIPVKKAIICVFIVVIVTIVLTFLVWLFYRLLYGILLRKLKRNYEELKKIDM